MKKNINVALMGRLAVGKTTLLNYLLNYKSPEQEVQNFLLVEPSKATNSFEFDFEQYKLTIFDQPGITLDDQSEWYEKLKDLEKYYGKMDFIFFCVDYTNGYFTKFERNLLSLLKGYDYQIVIVATKHNFVLDENDEVSNLLLTYHELLNKSSQYDAQVILGNTVHNSKRYHYTGKQILQLLDNYYFEMQSNLNVAIIGQSGVGKSALINYLFEETVANSGSGKPVTQFGFHKYRKNLDHYSVQLFDSWGLELDKYDTWFQELHTFLNKHNRRVD